MIRICGVVRESIVDGPGLRFVVFTQGCLHACPGCHNPESHSMDAGYEVSEEKIVEEMSKNPLLKGITLSGGDPVLQAKNLVNLCKRVHAMGKDVITYTGYTYEELLEMSKENPAVGELLAGTDLLIDGKFILAKRDLTLLHRGSSNQRVVDVAASAAAGHVVERDLSL